jgi:hypothetical protein
VDYDSPATKGDRLTALVVKGFTTLGEEMEPIQLRAWEEWYDIDPTYDPPRTPGWTWR